jgi:hypothetical protein
MNPDKYRSFTTEDFILDEDFQKLAKGNTIDGQTVDWLKDQLPEKAKEIAFAQKVINGLITPKESIPMEKKIAVLHTVLSQRKPKTRYLFLKYAAAIVLLVGISTTLYYYSPSKSDIERFAKTTDQPVKEAQLILADGQRIKIESKQSKIEYIGNGNAVVLNDTSKITQSKPNSPECYNQVIVPYGKRSKILLSDGTQVWLNSGSKLVYPPDFTDSKREVFLEGEAYFEVSQDKHKPFFVKTENFQVKVLGTKFGVQAYKDETNQNTVLLEGKVSLSSGKGLFAEEFELLPSQKAVISGTDKLITIANVRDAENYIAWIHGYLSLEDENFQGLINRISRYYNLEIEMDATVPDIRVSGKLDLKDDPKRILDGVSKIFNVKYEQKGEKITVHK